MLRGYGVLNIFLNIKIFGLISTHRILCWLWWSVWCE